jgi:hypothetical protein
MRKVIIDWLASYAHPSGLETSGSILVDVQYTVSDRDELFEEFGPRSMSSSWSQDYVEYILVAKPTPGIVPRDLLAYTLCGQRLPFQPNHIIPAAAMASLTMPPSEAPKSHQRPH